jgi:hypothetical protein
MILITLPPWKVHQRQEPATAVATQSGRRESDAETAPLVHPEYYQHEIDVAWVAEAWRRDSVIASTASAASHSKS